MLFRSPLLSAEEWTVHLRGRDRIAEDLRLVRATGTATTLDSNANANAYMPGPRMRLAIHVNDSTAIELLRHTPGACFCMVALECVISPLTITNDIVTLVTTCVATVVVLGAGNNSTSPSFYSFLSVPNSWPPAAD